MIGSSCFKSRTFWLTLIDRLYLVLPSSSLNKPHKSIDQSCTESSFSVVSDGEYKEQEQPKSGLGSPKLEIGLGCSPSHYLTLEVVNASAEPNLMPKKVNSPVSSKSSDVTEFTSRLGRPGSGDNTHNLVSQSTSSSSSPVSDLQRHRDISFVLNSSLQESQQRKSEKRKGSGWKPMQRGETVRTLRVVGCSLRFPGIKFRIPKATIQRVMWHTPFLYRASFLGDKVGVRCERSSTRANTSTWNYLWWWVLSQLRRVSSLGWPETRPTVLFYTRLCWVPDMSTRTCHSINSPSTQTRTRIRAGTCTDLLRTMKSAIMSAVFCLFGWITFASTLGVSKSPLPTYYFPLLTKNFPIKTSLLMKTWLIILWKDVWVFNSIHMTPT